VKWASTGSASNICVEGRRRSELPVTAIPAIRLPQQKPAPSRQEPRVRIHLPPAASLGANRFRSLPSKRDSWLRELWGSFSLSSVTQLRVRNGSSCPTPAIDRPRPERRPQMESGRSRFARRVMPMLAVSAEAANESPNRTRSGPRGAGRGASLKARPSWFVRQPNNFAVVHLDVTFLGDRETLHCRDAANELGLAQRLELLRPAEAAPDPSGCGGESGGMKARTGEANLPYVSRAPGAHGAGDRKGFRKCRLRVS
jgi:hypothetical protein